jgi:hypothetical protein
MSAVSAAATSVCSQCGKGFRCGMEGGDVECWCAALPALMPVPAQAGTGVAVPACLCPDCLTARLDLSCGERGTGVAMRLMDKILAVSAGIVVVLVVVLTLLSALSFRQFSIYTAERHARSIAETVKVGLTESMINGTIGKRQQFLARLAGVPGVNQVRVDPRPGGDRPVRPRLAWRSVQPRRTSSRFW